MAGPILGTDGPGPGLLPVGRAHSARPAHRPSCHKKSVLRHFVVTPRPKGRPLPAQLAFRTVAVVAVLAFVGGCLAAAVQAQDVVPTAAQRTLVAAGIGQVKVTPKDRQDNASIAAAVEAAEAKALPAAVADAKAQAQALATAAGVTLGGLLSVGNQASPPGFYGPFFYTNGTFGPGKYCAKVRTVSFVKGKDGKRHRKLLPPHRVCRVPPSVTRTVQLTYALA